MIQVEQKETIRRLYFIKRHNVRQIAKELGYSRKTIKKVCKYVNNGKLSSYRQVHVIRLEMSDLNAFLMPSRVKEVEK
jgi:DNA-binding transcriptional regulator LsrR (DeoR family)